MPVGYSRTKSDMDARIGQMAIAFRQIMTEVDRFVELGEALSDAQLNAMGYEGDSSTEGSDVWLLRGVIADMQKLVAIGRGKATQAEPYNFTRRPRMVMGVQ